MSDQTIILRKTPFYFIRLLVIIEFIFAFLPVFATVIFPVQAEYNQTVLAQSLSFTVFFILVLTTLQVLIIAISFFSWYLPVYRIDPQSVGYKRSGANDFKELIKIQAISCLSPEQHWLGKRFDYGDVFIYSNTEVGVVPLRDIANPTGIAIKLEELSASYWDPSLPLPIQPAPELIAAGESQTVEFKASILWDYRQKRPNKTLSEPIMKTLAAFMNSTGGTLLIGIHDDGSVLGLEADFSAMTKSTPDGFELIFNNAFNRLLGVEYRQWVNLSFPEIEGKTICVATAQPATTPVYFQHQGQEEFYIRAGNASQPLPLSKATVYIRDRFEI
ncbi:MAG TPA: hypothetical protein DEH25_08330 [Chloroflexi bacterium]|nr:hypothetical protein [Chloroflexota bacterium]